MKLRFIFSLFILFLGVTAVTAQGDQIRITLAQVDNDDTPLVHDDAFPTVAVEAVPVNEFGVPVMGLAAADFTLTEGSSPVSFTFEPRNSSEIPMSIMVVLDVSGPMQPELADIRTAVNTLYPVLEQTDESGILAFSTLSDGTTVDLSEPFPQLLPGRELNFTSDEGALINLVNALQVEENAGTPLYDALFKGIRMAATQAFHERRAVVLITNGRDVAGDGTVPGSRAINGDTAIEEARRSRIPIFTVAWRGGADSAFLERAAIFTGGAFRQVNTAEQMGLFFVDMANQLRQTYRLTYQSEIPADNAAHRLVIGMPRSIDPAGLPVEFVARTSRTPQITQVLGTPFRGNAAPLETQTAVQGRIRVEPVVQARFPVAAVNYYLDGGQTAVFSATSPPYSYDWDTSELAPGAHTLQIEIIDTADPPNVGFLDVTVRVDDCNLLCRGEQMLGFNPLWALGGILLLFALAFGYTFFLRSNDARTAQPAYQPPSAVNMQPQDFTPAAYEPPASRPHTPAAPPGSHTIVDEPETPPGVPTLLAEDMDSKRPATMDKTEVLYQPTVAPDKLAYLIDVENGQSYRLGAQATLGSAPGSDIVVATAVAHHALIILQQQNFVLQAMADVQVNGRAASQHALSAGDHITLGGRNFVFKVVK